MRKKTIYLLCLMIIALLGVIISPTYAKFTSGFTTEEDVVGMTLSFNLGISNIEEYEEIILEKNTYEVFHVEITNATSDEVYYGVWYKMVNPNEKTDDITIARLEGTETTTSGTITENGTQTVTLIILNQSDDTIKVNIGVGSSTTSTSDIEYLNGKYLITGTYALPNSPNIDDGNLISVYYDETNEVWRKADSSNLDFSWYNYYDQKWANAILIADETTRTNYQIADIDTEISISDITAFYVWIPRYKYRVWNITRQTGDESTYAYSAYSNGIEIEWENGTNSTGNVECSYDVTTTESDANLSDVCIYNDTDTITTTSVNSNYQDAWYTHPAFTFGEEEKTGIWVGKFETSGTLTAPTVLPDQLPLTNQVLSLHFTSSKVFQSYGISDSMDAHMMTNLEWGAVAYLTHSIYGLCDKNVCRDVYINNSSSRYTGRSGGALAGSDDLKQINVYTDASGTETEDYKYKSSGYYTYKGYFIDYDGNVTSVKDTSKVASTTGNITGIYDMVGGAYEYVMGNMVDSTGVFYPSSSGTSWNGSTTLSSKYYNSYSYGTEYYTQSSFNRARLGDATAENIGIVSTTGAWKSGTAITGTFSITVNETTSWFQRGGYYEASDSGIFNTSRNEGGSTPNDTFCSSIS